MSLEKILERASQLRIAVVGDLIIDRYIDGVVERISPEAPVPVLNITGTRENPGGAGNVVENLRGLGCQVSFFHQPNPPIKTRVMAGSQHVIRMDDESEPVWMKYDDLDIGFDYGIQNWKFDVVVISDYGKGCISEEVAEQIMFLCQKYRVPVVVDSKREPWMFKGCTVFKCNQKEWDRIDDDVSSCFNGFLSKAIVITQGSKGINFYTPFTSGSTSTLSINVCDPCGAGDTVTAILAIMQGFKSNEYGALFDRNLLHACDLANIAASEVCRHPGVFAITKETLIKRYNEVYEKK